jgi:hypothetical protein
MPPALFLLACNHPFAKQYANHGEAGHEQQRARRFTQRVVAVVASRAACAPLSLSLISHVASSLLFIFGKNTKMKRQNMSFQQMSLQQTS